jgi:hypothetical protein
MGKRVEKGREWERSEGDTKGPGLPVDTLVESYVTPLSVPVFSNNFREGNPGG